MDKNAIKKYAVWARKELISRVAQKAQQYGITETEMVDAGADSVNGKVLSAEEMQQRRALIAQINEKGYQQVMEEVAYTWFNRFSALRFMEVNGYLPSHVRVFTDENNAFKPQILAEALHLELDKLDKDKVYALKETEQTEELYKYLLIVQCNALNSILPGMFQTIADYTELLLPDNLLREGSVIEQMISQIPEDNWQDAVQIIGWLYQYYNSEKKDDVFAALKKNVKIIVNDFGGANILITADHGFLYTYSPLTEDDKVDKTSFHDMEVEYGRRYAIMQKEANPQYLLPVKFLDGKTEYTGFAPREGIRIKMNGGGLNFVHGGISLQEMTVPVIEYHYLRNGSMEYRRNKQKYDTLPVTVSLLSSSRKISNMIFSLDFYQKDAVSANREAATYLVWFTDEYGKPVSDTQKIIADKTSENGADRTFHCNFNLKSMKFSNTATYYLVIADEQGQQMQQREQFQIDIAFAIDEFDFFN